ncbi:AAA domain-containing protein [Mucilaginibacter frigoritolerans]|uniref:AAA domain-containing protein n=1 Tax=Mucilaginibacter frigoritolerans TaxID=652788 RepID=A0A562TML5_9SPHI|nr:AAA family ATPase [Mucilaginibacter frigoritolerans]TWI94762.1 AAA domain-containing protein [Mucilaginibacter frigoritolerans]
MTFNPPLGAHMQSQQPQQQVSALDTELNQPEDLLNVKTANHWMEEASTRPVPKMLFDKFWFEGELCILFADSNLGKSILAVQIGNSINTGIPISPFKIQSQAQPILYCDFELTDKQFESRYSNDYQDHYAFGTDFYRAELNPDSEPPQGFNDFDEFIIASLERSIVQTGVKVIIVDNLTYLRNETEQSKNALSLMKHLKALKNRHGLSILALAHTPKRDLSQQITANDLQGSKMLMNFCDSAFTIGQSCADKDLRYLKQIKQRNTEQVYGYTNICLCRVNKPFNFLQFEFVNYGSEVDHLRKASDRLSEAHMEQAVQLKLQGKTLRDIAKEMGISYQKVDRLIKAHTAKA